MQPQLASWLYSLHVNSQLVTMLSIIAILHCMYVATYVQYSITTYIAIANQLAYNVTSSLACIGQPGLAGTKGSKGDPGQTGGPGAKGDTGKNQLVEQCTL